MNDSGIKIEVIKLQDSVQDDPKPIVQPEPVKTISVMNHTNKKPDISFNDLSFQMESSLQNVDLSRIRNIQKPVLEPIKPPIKVKFDTPEPVMNRQSQSRYKPQILPEINQQIKPMKQTNHYKPITNVKVLPNISKKVDTESQKIKKMLGKESDGYKTGYLPSMQQKSVIKLPKKPVSLSKFQALLGIKTEVKGLRNG